MAESGQGLLVGLQVFDVLSVGGGHSAMKGLGRGKAAKHPRGQRAPRQLIGPFLGVPARAVRIVAPRVQHVSVDEHRYPLFARRMNCWRS
jgi:hypothetical protein